MLTNSLISGPGWAGTNGNITGDPLFVNAPGGDYHLAAGSPAINAGTTVGAPSYDLDGAPRDAQPDIGAYEFGATPRPLLTVTAEQLGGSGTVTSNPRHQLRNRVHRPLRPQHHRHAHRKARPRVTIPRLAARMLRKSPLHGHPQQRPIGHSSLRTLALQTPIAKLTDRAHAPAAGAQDLQSASLAFGLAHPELRS